MENDILLFHICRDKQIINLSDKDDKYKNLCVNEENNIIKHCINNNHPNCKLFYKFYFDCITFKSIKK